MAKIVQNVIGNTTGLGLAAFGSNAAAASGGSAGPVFNGLVSGGDPVFGHGTVKRNSAYSGNALQLEDIDNLGTYAEIGFDGDGYVTATDPFTNSRVTKIYDQWGVDHMLWGATGRVQLLPADANYVTARLSFDGTAFFSSTVLGNGSPTWSSQTPSLLATIIRTDNQVRAAIMGPNRTVGYALFPYGFIIQHTNGQAMMIDEQYGGIWPGTNAGAQIGEVSNLLLNTVSTGNQAYGYLDAVLKSTITHDGSIAYSTNTASAFRMPHTFINHPRFNGEAFEWHMYSHDHVITGAEAVALSASQDLVKTPP
jgi:hypothetical protein